MTKKQMAEFLARISSRLNKDKTEAEWVTFYMTFSKAELQEDCSSYGG